MIEWVGHWSIDGWGRRWIKGWVEGWVGEYIGMWAMGRWMD